MWRIKKLYFISPFILQNIFIWIPARILFRVFFRFKIYGRENLKNLEPPVIFAANHSSELDVFAVPDSLKLFSKFLPIFFTSREKSFYSNSGWKQVFYGGTFFKCFGSYPVYPGVSNFRRALKHHIGILDDGGSVLIFPEGKISRRSTKIKEGKAGVSALSYYTDRPVVPVKIEGLYNMKTASILKGKYNLTVKFGKPMYPDKLFSNSTKIDYNTHKEVSNKIINRIRSL